MTCRSCLGSAATLARGKNGATEAIMLAHGFRGEMLAGLVLAGSLPLSRSRGREGLGLLIGRAPALSIASTAFLFCRFAGRIAGVPGGLLLGRQQNRPFGLFGGKESFCLLCFALSLCGQLGCTRGLFGQFGLTRPFGGFSLGHADQTRLVHGHPGGVPSGDFGVFGCGAKLLQHCLLGGGGSTPALLVVRVLEAGHLFSGSSRPGAEWPRPSGSRHIEVSIVTETSFFLALFSVSASRT